MLEGDVAAVDEEASRGMSTILMRILLAEYVVIAAVCLFEGNYARLLYWIGASVLQISVLMMR